MFLDITKSPIHKGKNDKSDFIKIKNFRSPLKTLLKQCGKDSYTWRKIHLSTTYSIKDWDLEYVKNSQNSMVLKNLIRKKRKEI